MTRIVLLAAALLTVVVYAQKRSVPIVTGNWDGGVHYNISSVISTGEQPLLANASEPIWCQVAFKEIPLPIINASFIRYKDPQKRKFEPERNDTIHKAYLEIEPVVIHNMGKYRCEMEVEWGIGGNYTAFGNLMVYSSPFFHAKRSMSMVADETNEKRVTADKLYATEGAPMEIHCPAVGFPKPNITWYKGGEVIDADDERVSLANDSTLLVIEKFAKSDAGVYRCTATNEYPSRLDKGSSIHEASLAQEVVIERNSSSRLLLTPPLLLRLSRSAKLSLRSKLRPLLDHAPLSIDRSPPCTMTYN